MNAVQSLQIGRSLKMAVAALAAAGALALAGLVGYLVKGSTTLITRTTVSAPASAAPADTTQVPPYGEHFSGALSAHTYPYGEH